MAAAVFGSLLAPVVARAAGPDPINLAFGAEATQSSTYNGAVAAQAVDGNTYGVFDRGTVSHTRNEAEPWWEVDLGESAEITG